MPDKNYTTFIGKYEGSKGKCYPLTDIGGWKDNGDQFIMKWSTAMERHKE